MNDYKELIEVLKNAEHIALCGNGAFNTVLVERCYEAADAVEQLVRERDAAVADLHLVANNCFEDYVFSACRCCKKNDTCNGQPATGCEFEWRGAQDE